jgi:hypothetical protein
MERTIFYLSSIRPGITGSAIRFRQCCEETREKLASNVLVVGEVASVMILDLTTTTPNGPKDITVPDTVIGKPSVVTTWPSTSAEDISSATVMTSPAILATNDKEVTGPTALDPTTILKD